MIFRAFVSFRLSDLAARVSCMEEKDRTPYDRLIQLSEFILPLEIFPS